MSWGVSPVTAPGAIRHCDRQVDEFRPLADDNRRFVNGWFFIGAVRRVLPEGRNTASEQRATDGQSAYGKSFFVHDGLFYSG
jgi:hypothetical protein